MKADPALRPETAAEKHGRDLEEADRLADEAARHRSQDPVWLARQAFEQREADRRAELREEARIYGG